MRPGFPWALSFARGVSEAHSDTLEDEYFVQHYNGRMSDYRKARSHDTPAAFLATLGLLSDEEALRIGKALCASDYAVRNFALSWHDEFFGRRDLLDRAIRHAIAPLSAKRWPEAAERIDRCRSASSCDEPLAARITLGLGVFRRAALTLDAAQLKRVLAFLERHAGDEIEDMDLYFEELGYAWREGPDGLERFAAQDLIERWRGECRDDAHLYELAERVLKAVDGADYDLDAPSSDFERAAARLMEVGGSAQ